MTRTAALLLAAAALPAHAEPQGNAREIKAQLESVRAPMFGRGQTLAGTTATYSVATTGCTTRVDVSFPSHSIGTSSFPARSEQVTIPWGKAPSVKVEGAYVVVAAPGLAKGRHFYAGSAAGAARLKTAMDAFAATCVAPAAKVPSARPAGIAERYPVEPDLLKTPQCRFRQVPELLLTDGKPPALKTAAYRLLPRESGDGESRFGVGLQSGAQTANWEGVLANPQIVLDAPAHARAQASRATIAVDGREIALVVKHSHGKSAFRTGGFQSWVSVNPVPYDPGALLAAIAKGSTMVVRVYAGTTQLSQWTFDVKTLRHAPAALKAARWSCR